MSAVLRLLPGNLQQSADNPLQLDRLPSTAGVELDYPVYQDPPAAALKRLAIIVFVTSLATPLLAWAGDLVPFVHLIGGANVLLLLVAAAMVVFGVLGRLWPLAAMGASVAALPVVVMLARDLPRGLTAAFIALCGQVILADRLANAYLRLKTAAPLERSQSIRARQIWDRRWFDILRPFRGAELYVVGYLVVFPIAWLTLQQLVPTGDRGDFLNAVRLFGMLAALSVAWLLAYENFVAPLFGRRAFSLFACCGATVRALNLWVNYNRLNAVGAGVHESSGGACLVRRALVVGLLLCWGCLWASLQVGRPVSGYERYWQLLPQLKAMVEGKEQSAEIDSLPPPPPLTPDEEEFLSLLPPEQAREYIVARMSGYIHEQAEDIVERTDPTPSKSPEAVLAGILKKTGRVLVLALVPSLGTILIGFAILLPMVGRTLAGIESCFGKEYPQRVLTTASWDNLVGRLQASADAMERQSLLLGVNSRDDTPVLVPRSVFCDHAHILGDTGSFKTSMGLAPLVSQLMMGGDCSVIVLDLKADDQSVFETLRVESERVGERLREHPLNGFEDYPYRWFTTVLGRSSFAFNPLTQSSMPKLSPDQRTDIITAALGLNYGSDYGRKYFGDANYDVLNYAMRAYSNVQTLTELEQILAMAESFPLPKETKKAGTHVQSSVRRLSRFKSLNAAAVTKASPEVMANAIDLSQFFQQPQALYVALPPSAGISNTAEIARIFLYSLLAAAQVHGTKRRQVYLVVDEFQRIVSNNVQLFLQAARSMNIGCILLNQSLSDLSSVGADLIPAVRTNTRFRQVFGAGHQEDIEDIIYSGGETTYASRSWSYAPGLLGMSLRGLSVGETRNSRLSTNDVLLATDAPGRSIASVRRGMGYAQYGGMPFIMDSVHHISEAEFIARKDAAWPQADDRMVVDTLADMADPSIRPTAPIILESPPAVNEQSPTQAVGTSDQTSSPIDAPVESGSETDQTDDSDIDPLELMFEEEQKRHQERIEKARAKSRNQRRRPQ